MLSIWISEFQMIEKNKKKRYEQNKESNEKCIYVIKKAWVCTV